ncbi:hypothetical protein D3C81_1984320 [compost metagenome]
MDRLLGKVAQGTKFALELARQSSIIQHQPLALFGQQSDAFQLLHFAGVQVIEQQIVFELFTHIAPVVLLYQVGR